MAKKEASKVLPKGRGKRLGAITKGSLVEGLEMKLDAERNIEDMKAGKFVVIEGDKNDFFSMVTDMRLDANNQEVLLHPPAREDELLRQVLSGTSTKTESPAAISTIASVRAL